MRSVRARRVTPPAASKNDTRPSKVCSRSKDVENHHRRHRLQHRMAPKQNTGPRPQPSVKEPQSDQSNWHSSPGAV